MRSLNRRSSRSLRRASVLSRQPIELTNNVMYLYFFLFFDYVFLAPCLFGSRKSRRGEGKSEWTNNSRYRQRRETQSKANNNNSNSNKMTVRTIVGGKLPRKDGANERGRRDQIINL